MAFDLIAFDVLAKDVTQSITTSLSARGIPTTPDKPIKSIAQSVLLLGDTESVRISQCLFLLKTIKLLSRENHPFQAQKAMILNAAVYFVYDKIKKSYIARAPESSGFYCSLQNSLGITKTYNADTNDQLKLYKQLEIFLYAQTYAVNKDGEPDPDCGYLQKASYKKLGPYYNIEVELNALSNKIASLKELKVDGAKERNNKSNSNSPVSATGSISSGSSPHTLFASSSNANSTQNELSQPENYRQYQAVTAGGVSNTN